MFAIPLRLVAALFALTLSASLSTSLAIPTLRLELFNDSSCTMMTSAINANIVPPVSATSLDTCVAAPSTLTQAGYASYQAACGISTNNQSYAFVHLFSNTSANATTCPTTLSLTTYVSVGTSSLTHTPSSCVGPVVISTLANQTSLVGSYSVYAKFDCESTTSAAHTAASGMATTISGLLMSIGLTLLLQFTVHTNLF